MKFFALIVTALCTLSAALVAVPAPTADMRLGSTGIADWSESWDGTISQDVFISSRSAQERTATVALGKRGVLGNVYLCQNFAWSGPCAVVHLQEDECAKLVDGWRYSLSVIGPDNGTTCNLYWSQDCTWGASAEITSPGGDFTGDYWGLFNDYVGSMKCFWNNDLPQGPFV